MNAPWLTPATLARVRDLLDSHERLLGRPLIPRSGDTERDAHTLFHAPFPVLAHGTEADPVLDYGNHAALALWEMDWRRFTATPSRLTAEPDSRDAREAVLRQAAEQGYVTGYRGVRVSASGRRFWVDELVLWRVSDTLGRPAGLAAAFPAWRYLDTTP